MKKLLILLVAGIFFSCEKKQGKNEVHASHLSENETAGLSVREQLLANIKLDTVKTKSIHETITLLGKATVDENKISVITSRVSGRIDKLYVRNTGEQIKTGQALYSIYSEELLADENEYLLALKQKAQFPLQQTMVNDLIQASKKKLLFWGLTKGQIEELERRKSSSALITFYSNVSGYLYELNISEGEYLNTGTPLFKIAQSASIWVEAQVYPYELKYLKQNTEFEIAFESFPNETFKGKMLFQSPAFEKDSKISYLRMEIQNKNGKVKPGMLASVLLKANAKRSLVIPKSAITLGDMPTVWVEKEKGKYEMRMVHLGIQTKSEVEVLHGLNERERIVSSGAYLINSAYILKHGAGSMAGMQM